MTTGRLPLTIVIVAFCLTGYAWCAEYPEEVKSALERAGDNKAQIQKALDDAPAAQKKGMQFLVAHMPQRDLESLSAEFLLENVKYAYQAYRESPWKDDVSEEIFFNEVLPYCNINERRDNWRKDFYRRFKPIVKDAKSPAEACAILNQKIFPLLKVRYSTKRPKADQSPYESIEAGTASCTGLSVVLIDACRSVGVPARFVGTPLWANKSGNHSWVEVWDDGWHFTGAAEPTGNQLDRAWFAGRAATAKRDHPLHAIYAVSYRRTPQSFPMVWAQKVRYVYAVNVTDRYAKQKKKQAVGNDPILSNAALASLAKHLQTEPDKRPSLAVADFAKVPLSKQQAEQAQQMLWQDHLKQLRKTRAAEMKARKITQGKLEMPFYYRVNGKMPKEGRSLYISLHGGGGAPKKVNDQQWENQKRLYSPQEGVYLVPRAPTNTWNLWHQGHIDTMFTRLIENMIAFEGVDPNRVYLHGYSAGGDGVYQLAPRMADQLAAAAMMAGHPNETSPLGLRNIAFTIHVGGRDAAYNRNKVAAQWQKKLADLRKADPGGYEHLVKIYPDKGHWLDRQDAVALPWMARHRRKLLPKKIVWKQDDVVHTRFYWLAVEKKDFRGRAEVTAQLDQQKIDISAKDVDRITIRCNDSMLDLDKPIVVTSQGKQLFCGKVERTIAVIAKTLTERGDPQAVFSGEVTVALPKP